MLRTLCTRTVPVIGLRCKPATTQCRHVGAGAVTVPLLAIHNPLITLLPAPSSMIVSVVSFGALAWAALVIWRRWDGQQKEVPQYRYNTVRWYLLFIFPLMLVVLFWDVLGLWSDWLAVYVSNVLECIDFYWASRSWKNTGDAAGSILLPATTRDLF
eukprot:TRINITY_DN41232_c0_g1_i1.p1 TRINITY_DN41232_c0_g1~~TRINITY_DN41232_c0_g1_i1.p1  ORF type:complete len:157 (-),score=11.73 TRINITY_DN41232_c0_g1_i1:26-496(-)